MLGGVVEPDDVDLAVPGQQFSYLRKHIFAVFGHVAAFVEPGVRLVGEAAARSERMVDVDREMRMMPIDDRIVETDLQPLGAAGLDVFLDEVAPERRVGDLVIRHLGIPHAETFVMLRGEDDILHPRLFCRLRPFARVEQIGIETGEILFVVGFVGDVFVAPHPFMTRGHRVQSEMDEHAETVVLPPRQAFRPTLGSFVENAFRQFAGRIPGSSRGTENNRRNQH